MDFQIIPGTVRPLTSPHREPSTSSDHCSYTRGQEYKEDLPTPPSRFDHQSGYVEFWLDFIGVQEVRALAVENTWGDKAEASLRAAREKVAALALDF
jgi:FMN-dependent NADH-azoreductase